ncbi:MAG: hypothetical protein BGO98_25935 [Myxococcales bacterium 68-20]|nr:MAG: hypothetical protein BGO98_25935 [Myxococcales bacterium 68-20]
MQGWPGAHAFPQAPQFFGSELMSASQPSKSMLLLQSAQLFSQMRCPHSPCSQTYFICGGGGPASGGVGGHMFPHAPQLNLSFMRSVHMSGAHHVFGGEHSPVHCF